MESVENASQTTESCFCGWVWWSFFSVVNVLKLKERAKQYSNSHQVRVRVVRTVWYKFECQLVNKLKTIL